MSCQKVSSSISTTDAASETVTAPWDTATRWTFGMPMLMRLQIPENGIADVCRAQLTHASAFLEEALTTVIVTMWATSPILSALVFFYLLICIKTLRALLVVYLVLSFFDPRPYDGVGRRIPALRRLPIWNHVNKYFQPNIVFEEALDANAKYVFGSHPHGVISYMSQLISGTTGMGIESHFPGLVVRGVTMPATFSIPFFRDYALAMGCLSCDRNSIRQILSERRHRLRQSLLIVVGGAEESMLAHDGSADLVLLKRRGFIFEAVRAGCDIVPIYNFNENSIYRLLPNPPGSLVHRFEMAVRSAFGFTILLFHGRNVFFTPYKTQLTAVVGRPIKVERNLEPTAKDIEVYHAQYVEELTRIYNKHRPKYAPDAKDMHFVA
ncbi:diacylglycerol O-acyltransferase 1 [Kickxella alabastrina]|uniref:Diacylglycerol O-acyltransferase 1 n=1 Tax=Kickxella alabastrina TaxID=61397 RepID=A0ACC1IL33_9FUNG|nr:diacylglycerol O-acyltransferase 1 [Kickxella alabastrina]